MGSIAQEIGHDLIINYFINKVLKPSSNETLFYITHPAMGPLRDIFFFDAQQQEFVSAWNNYPSEYITEYNLRLKLPQDIIEKIKAETRYWEKSWYKNLSEKLNYDLKSFLDKICDELEELIKAKFSDFNKLPDFIEINQACKTASIGEIKFEYLPKKALNEFLSYHYLAQQLKIPFYLVFPKKGSYARTDYNWLKKNLPADINFYTFAEIAQDNGIEKPIVLPSLDIIFKQINSR